MPRSALGKACDYALGRWGQLRSFLDYGQIELSNNLAENAIRPVAFLQNFKRAFNFQGRFRFLAAWATSRFHGFDLCYFVSLKLLFWGSGEAVLRARVRPLFCELLPWLRVYSSVLLSTKFRLESSKRLRIHRERNHLFFMAIFTYMVQKLVVFSSNTSCFRCTGSRLGWSAHPPLDNY